jgi:hypothetical protein
MGGHRDGGCLLESQPAGQLVREHQIGQLGLTVRLECVVTAVRLQVVETDGGDLIESATCPSNPPRAFHLDEGESMGRYCRPMSGRPQPPAALSGGWLWSVRVVVILTLVGVGYVVGRAVEVPLSTEFWKSFGQPLATFGAGVFALIAGSAALLGAHLVSSRSHAATMIDVQHRDEAARVEQLWTRFEWVVSRMTAVGGDGESAIDEVQAATMVVSIRDAARKSNDDHLLTMLNVYLGDQLGGLAAEVGLAGDSGAVAAGQ